MNLKEAVKKVITQNISIGYTPNRFISITKNGDAENLGEIISNLVLKKELLEELERAIEKYGNVLTIEDMIVREQDYFGLSEHVVTQAKARSEWFDKLRDIYKS